LRFETHAVIRDARVRTRPRAAFNFKVAAILRRVLDRLRHVLDLARLFDLPDRHPDRMIGASVVLYIGLGVIIGITVWSHWRAAHP
jgi:hypothetical protein